jgi:hypothetical protein
MNGWMDGSMYEPGFPSAKILSRQPSHNEEHLIRCAVRDLGKIKPTNFMGFGAYMGFFSVMNIILRSFFYVPGAASQIFICITKYIEH